MLKGVLRITPYLHEKASLPDSPSFCFRLHCLLWLDSTCFAHCYASIRLDKTIHKQGSEEAGLLGYIILYSALPARGSVPKLQALT